MMGRKWCIIIFIVVGIMVFNGLAYAKIPNVINYQGKFSDKDDNPLSGNYLVTFRFYDIADGGTALWEEGHILNIQKGIFHVLLGSVKPLEIDFNKDLWLGIEIFNDGEMSPRIKLASAPYAFNAKTIDMIDSSQLVRNDIDTVMSGTLTLKKGLVLEGGSVKSNKIILTNAAGSEYYLWIDKDGILRVKKGIPALDKDGVSLIKKTSCVLSPRLIQQIAPFILIGALLILGLIVRSIRKKK